MFKLFLFVSFTKSEKVDHGIFSSSSKTILYRRRLPTSHTIKNYYLIPAEPSQRKVSKLDDAVMTVWLLSLISYLINNSRTLQNHTFLGPITNYRKPGGDVQCLQFRLKTTEYLKKKFFACGNNAP